MKYVRTKDGRIIHFATKKKYENDKVTFDWFIANYCGGGINVLRVADTIEELRDEFIGIDNSNCYFHFTELEKVNGNYSYLNEEYKAFYGATWTDKGLIYVAKINERGVLELL